MNQMKLLTLMLGLTALVTGAYFVKKGDTLWDLSGTFFNDPFAWPDLWENNRHIEDPHWIYPGDSIYIGEHDTASVKESKPVNKNLFLILLYQKQWFLSVVMKVIREEINLKTCLVI